MWLVRDERWMESRGRSRGKEHVEFGVEWCSWRGVKVGREHVARGVSAKCPIPSPDVEARARARGVRR